MDITLIAVLLISLAAGVVLGHLLAGRKLLAEYATVKANLETAQDKADSLQDALESERAAHQQTREQAQKASISLEEQARRLEEQKASLTQMQKFMEEKFANTSTQLLETMSKKFNGESEKKLGELLTPMRERLSEFSKLVTDSFGEHNKEQRSLRNEIEKIVMQADSLSKALRGDVKAQGNWGEIMLERILEESGLIKDQDYELQMDVKSEDGSRKRPDVVVKLPEGKHIIVDSKVSLTAYDRYCATEDATERAALMKDFITSIRAHVTGLASKNYQGSGGIESPDFVLLFMPIEGAFSLALQHDRELYSFAWEKRIALVGPTTLFSNLRTIASLWQIEKTNKNAEEIAAQGANLYDKFVGFVEDLQGVGKELEQAKAKYDGAMNKLSEGQGNLINRATAMKKLGLKTKKDLPKELVDDELLMLEQEAS